ncbi:hypothetical protein [Streptomyces sp. NPDC008317]|uniref:hypothetical protein n=1 Tax=Streptomyces sp. NPDC008317 TaxID=3364827 RepID=UPI0036E8F1A5
MTRIPVSRGIAALAVAITAAALPASRAVLHDAPTVAVVRAADDPTPSPTDSTCPDGAEKPCPASTKDREEVDGQRDKVEKDEAQAKEDIGAAKGEATKCPPTSKDCMTNLAGDGHEQKEGMAKTQQELEGVHPAPSNNAQSAVSGECSAFGADLPPALSSSGDPADLTRVCELMNP